MYTTPEASQTPTYEKVPNNDPPMVYNAPELFVQWSANEGTPSLTTSWRAVFPLYIPLLVLTHLHMTMSQRRFTGVSWYSSRMKSPLRLISLTSISMLLKKLLRRLHHASLTLASRGPRPHHWQMHPYVDNLFRDTLGRTPMHWIFSTVVLSQRNSIIKPESSWHI